MVGLEVVIMIFPEVNINCNLEARNYGESYICSDLYCVKHRTKWICGYAYSIVRNTTFKCNYGRWEKVSMDACTDFWDVNSCYNDDKRLALVRKFNLAYIKVLNS